MKKEKTEFAVHLDFCGLSKQGAAELLNVRYDTVKSWYYGRRNPPEAVIEQMKQLTKAIKDIFIYNTD